MSTWTEIMVVLRRRGRKKKKKKQQEMTKTKQRKTTKKTTTIKTSMTLTTLPKMPTRKTCLLIPKLKMREGRKG